MRWWRRVTQMPNFTNLPSMHRSLVILWLTLLLAIAAIAILSHRSWQRQAEAAQSRAEKLMTALLVPIRDDLRQQTDRYAIELERLVNSLQSATNELSASEFLDVKRSPLVEQLVVIDREKRVVFPSNTETMNASQFNLLRNALEMLQGLPQEAVGSDDSLGQSMMTQRTGPTSRNAAPQANFAAWFHNRGLMLSYLVDLPDEQRMMLVLPRGRWLADIVASLPEVTSNAYTNTGSFKSELVEGIEFRLMDVGGTEIYRWGDRPMMQRSNQQASLNAILPLDFPLDALTLQCIANPSAQRALIGENSRWPYVLAFGSLAMLIFGLGTIVTLSFRSAINQAARKISFVNQVSHELKTPLTNVMLYCDLLARDVDQIHDSEDAAILRTRLDTMQIESKRLEHLIDNILQFARSNQNKQKLHLRLQIPDETLTVAVDRLEPRLTRAGITIVREFSAPLAAMLDEQVVHQAVDNLLSNVEKYAATGGRVVVRSSQNGELLMIQIADCGPGIPVVMRERIFEPFVRLDDSLESSAGTGIGLSIVRQLSKLHGGDCKVLPTDHGACFQVTIRATRPADV